jgi:hypothetical protein
VLLAAALLARVCLEPLAVQALATPVAGHKVDPGVEVRARLEVRCDGFRAPLAEHHHPSMADDIWGQGRVARLKVGREGICAPLAAAQLTISLHVCPT